MPELSIQFLGAAGTVTGSRHLIEAGGKRFLIDCGLFQGLKELRLQNRAPFPVDPASIKSVILTHAHLDHSGYLPLLHKNGFHGKVFATEPTRDLARILLADAARIEEDDADYANRKGYSKHHPAAPLFTVEDARKACRLIEPVELDSCREISPGVKIRFTSSGHILGSALVELETEGRLLVFSGDLGRNEPILLKKKAEMERADYLILESTYGDRLHSSEPVKHALAQAVIDTVSRGGHLLIPSFAVGRTQDLLLLFSQLRKESRISDVPIYLDSPLAKGATELYQKYPEWLAKRWESMQALSETATIVETSQESKALLGARGSTVVIAGSGMITGGRILHHLAHRLGDSRNMVLLSGFQAAGTRGRLLQDGASELKMHGRFFQVRAEVRNLSGLSAHADQCELLSWIGSFKKAPAKTFIVHGEPQAADALRVKIQDTLNWDAAVARPLEKVELP